MSKRLSPKEIKRDIREDELRTLLSGTVEQARNHARELAIAGIALVAIALVALGVFLYLSHRKTVANAELGDAIALYGAPVVEEGAEPDDPQSPTFASEEDRAERARAAFEEIRGMTGAGIAGDIAELYLAEMDLENGETERAREVWERFLAEHDDHVLTMSVRINLIHLDRAEGKAEEVAVRLQEELDEEDKSLPDDVLLYELAKTLEQLGRREEAQEHYQTLVDDYPTSAYTLEASQKVTAIG